MKETNRINLKPNNANDLIWACAGAIVGGVILGAFFFDGWIGAGVGAGAALTLVISVYRKEKKE